MRRRDESLPHHADQKAKGGRIDGLIPFTADNSYLIPADAANELARRRRRKPKTVRRTKWYWVWRGRLR